MIAGLSGFEAFLIAGAPAATSTSTASTRRLRKGKFESMISTSPSFDGRSVTGSAERATAFADKGSVRGSLAAVCIEPRSTGEALACPVELLSASTRLSISSGSLLPPLPGRTLRLWLE